jgi:hypothetical protein
MVVLVVGLIFLVEMVEQTLVEVEVVVRTTIQIIKVVTVVQVSLL